MNIVWKIFSFIYFVFLLFLIKILSISDYEWMVGKGDIKNLCQLPLGGRYTIEPILVLIPGVLMLLLNKNKKIKYVYIAITGMYLFGSFFLRFNWC